MASFEIFRNDPSVRTVALGETIFSEGDSGDVAYVVTEGEVELTISEHAIETVTAGGIFGELALIDHQTRSATATARTQVKIVSVDQRRFLYLLQNTPFFAIEVMSVMAQRLRRMDATV